MSGIGKRVFPILLAAALVGGALVMSGCAQVAPATAARAGERSVTVLGQGTVAVQPNIAQLSLGVETFAETVAEASQQNNTKMATLMAKLAELGIAEKDIQTSNFSISFERYPGKMADAEATPQYRVSNMVQVKIRDLPKAGAILDAVVGAGANQVWGINFTLEDPSTVEAQARSKAVEDARQRAEALAKLNNVQLGQVLVISEAGSSRPVPLGMGAAGKAMDSTSISPGEVEVAYQVNVTYEIK